MISVTLFRLLKKSKISSSFSFVPCMLILNATVPRRGMGNPNVWVTLQLRFRVSLLRTVMVTVIMLT